MPTTVVKKIGATSSPVTMDYSSVQAWEDDCPADLTAVDQIWRGECYNQGTLSGNWYINGETTDATRYIHLTTATGQSFRDQSAVRTTALFPNASNGVYISSAFNYGPVFGAGADYTRLSNLQMVQGGAAAAFSITAGEITLDSCIVQGENTIGGNENGQGTWINCLLIAKTTYGQPFGVRMGKLYNCTVVVPSGSTSTNAALQGSNYFASRVHHNCAVFGFVPLTGGADGGTSDYAATDATTNLEGAHTISGLSMASQFVNAVNDFRALDTGGLKAGTPDATNAPIDISGFTRSTTTPYIGCWEAGVPPPPFAPSRGIIVMPM